MKTSQMMESKFLKKDDVGRGALLTIAGVNQHNVAKQGADPEYKWCMEFQETDKPLVLNSSNIQLATSILGNDDTDFWTGRQIVAYTDPNIMYAGKVVGGIRLRAPKTGATAQPARVAQQLPPVQAAPVPQLPSGEMLEDDDIPF